MICNADNEQNWLSALYRLNCGELETAEKKMILSSLLSYLRHQSELFPEHDRAERIREYLEVQPPRTMT